MKIRLSILSAIVAATMALTGCSKSDSTQAKVDPSPIEKSFASAEAATKAAAEKAVEAIKKADYSAATEQLKKLLADVKLTDEQKKAINDVLSKVQNAVAEMGKKAAAEGNKALGDVQKAIGK
jgi:hypothetical protein